MNKFPTMEQLSQMPIHKLRALDIRSADEEAMVQVVINQKVQTEPVRTQPSIRIPDIRNGEDEAKWQRIIDAKREELRPNPISMMDIVPDGEVVIPESEEEQSEEIQVETKRFCEFCSSKGVRHLKVCTRPQ